MKKHFILLYLISVQICFSQVSLLQRTNSFEIKTDKEQRLFNLIKTDPTTITYNYIEINKRYLGSDNIVLEIDGDSHILKLDRIEQRSLGNYSVFYKFKDEFSTAFFTCLDDDILGFIQIKNKNYEIKTIAEGKYILRKFDQSKYGECGNTSYNVPNETENTNQSKSMVTIGQTCNLRILILYTDAVSSNVNNPINLCQQSIDLLNQTFINSGVNYQAELAYAGETNYIENDDNQQDVNFMRADNDGYMDEVDGLRDFYSADLCVLFSTSSTGGMYSGISGAIYSDEANVYAQVRYDEVVNNISFPHEIGHLLGCRHNDDLKITPFFHGHGFIQSNNQYRDIMARKVIDVTRIPYWSNPNITLYGLPFGSSFSDNVQVLNTTIYDARTFRQSFENVLFVQPFIFGYFQGTIVAENIATSGIVTNTSSNSLSIQAGTSISLKNGFFSENGSFFSAKIVPVDDCLGNPLAGGIENGGEIFFKSQFIESNSFAIYPNPSENNLQIKILNEINKISNVSIFQYTGKKCEVSYDYDFSSNEYRFNLENLSSGIYLITFLLDGKLITEKITKI